MVTYGKRSQTHENIPSNKLFPLSNPLCGPSIRHPGFCLPRIPNVLPVIAEINSQHALCHIVV